MGLRARFGLGPKDLLMEGLRSFSVHQYPGGQRRVLRGDPEERQIRPHRERSSQTRSSEGIIAHEVRFRLKA